MFQNALPPPYIHSLLGQKPSLDRTSLVRVFTQTTREYNLVCRTFYDVDYIYIYGIRDRKPEKGQEWGSQLRDLESQCVGSGSVIYFYEIRDQANIKNGLRDQNSHRFWDQGSTFWAKNTGPVTKKYTSLRP